MAPQDYIAARHQPKNANVDAHVMLDGHPYYPFLEVEPSDHGSIRSAVAKLLGKSSDVTHWDVSALEDKHEHKSSCKVSVVSGGITNQLFRVTVGDSGSVLMRIFGAEGMIDRDIENATFAALAANKLAPAYYGRFANGRLEEWLDGMEPLTPREMAKEEISQQVAQQMATIHSQFRVPADLAEFHNPEKPCLWAQLHVWMAQSLAATFQSVHDTERASILQLDKIHEELNSLEQDVIPKDAQIAFCHNDLQAANIVYSSDTNAIRLVDFEYGGMNYTAFDIANHFNEYAGGTDDGITHYEWYPTEEHQRQFLNSYLAASGRPAENVDALHNDVKAFVLVNHLYWGLWAINQASSEGCQDFDYLLYASNRFARYFESKAKENLAG